MLCYHGEVTRVLVGGLLWELDGTLLLLLTHVPYENFQDVRQGTQVQVWNAHTVLSGTGHLMALVSCMRTHIAVAAFSPFTPVQVRLLNYHHELP